MWSLSLSGGKIKDGPKAERKARRISPKVLLRGTMNISEYGFQDAWKGDSGHLRAGAMPFVQIT